MVSLQQYYQNMPRFYPFLFLLLSISFGFAQDNGSVWGHIRDMGMDNEPLIFAQVELKGTSRSIQTNFHGNFELNDIDPGHHTLIVSYLGYEPVEAPVVVSEDQITRLDLSLGKKTYKPELSEETKITLTSSSTRSSAGQN